ncbi:MAG: hypothetical protein DRP66_00125 [Planctomycetota bacterium]|nr:MAG: hypothetical protein DRP66_00125 [Planctomycetota bacterium]
MLTLVSQALKFVRLHGYSELISRLLRAAVGPFYQRQSRYIVHLDFDEAAEPDPGFNFAELTKNDSEKMLRVMYVSPKSLAKRFDDGDRCFGIIENDELISYFWAEFKHKELHELRLEFELPGRQAWMYNAITVGKARGRACYPNVIRFMAQSLRQSGFREAYVDVDPANIPSVKGLEKAGYTRVVMIDMKKIFSKVTYSVQVYDETVWKQLSKCICNSDNIATFFGDAAE